MINLAQPIALEEYTDAKQLAQMSRCSLCLGSLQVVGVGKMMPFIPVRWRLKCRGCGREAYEHSIVYKEEAEQIERKRIRAKHELEIVGQSAEESLAELGF